MGRKSLQIRENYMQLELINALEVADYFDCCISQVRKLTAKKKIKAYGIGGTVKYKPEDIRKSLQEIN